MIRLLLLAAFSFLPQHASGQMVWTPLKPTFLPPAMYSAQMVLDPRRERCVLYGGVGNARNAVYEWDGTNWTEHRPSIRPSARSHIQLSYDLVRGKTVLFSGYQAAADTWEWDGTTWTQHKPATAPGRRCCAMMDYYIGNLSTILFGGYLSGMLGDTWAWNGKTWRQLNPATSPPARCCAEMVWDQARNQIVLFGGARSSSTGDYADTWVWDGKNWTQKKPTRSPSPRRGHSMVYNPVTKRIVLFGGGAGGNGTPSYNDTWEWDGSNWTQITTTGAPVRFIQMMGFDSVRERIVMFGGRSSRGTVGDMWDYHNGSFTSTTHAISLSAGGSQIMDLSAGTAHRGRYYVVLGSASGTSPGIKVGNFNLPLNVDPYFNFLLASPNTFLSTQVGILDVNGKGKTGLTMPRNSPVGLIGLRVDHAYGVVNLAGTTIYRTSGSVLLRFAK